MTSEQLALVKKINLQVNDDPRWINHEGFCVEASIEKMELLQKAGIPSSPITVDAGPRYNNEAHSILQVEDLYLDINQPWPLTLADMNELGYKILET